MTKILIQFLSGFYVTICFNSILWHINHCKLLHAKYFLYVYIKYKGFGLVLWHIKHCRLFNAKFSLYIRGAFIKFPDFFVQAFKIVVVS